ncbi:zinc finger protein OZF-like isoform X1 [Ptychodera flava]|uniref:zinc finger protein OZF-like isoform X1 n=1 Tax=Ptychodera flava TaxID=63121 RepID=UPI00396A5B17
MESTGVSSNDNSTPVQQDQMHHKTKRNTDSTRATASTSTGYDCDVLFSPKECSAICKAARRLDQLHEFGTAFEILSNILCLKYQYNTFSVTGVTTIIQSLVHYGLITLECGGPNRENNKGDMPQHDLDHGFNQSTAQKYSSCLSESHSDNDGCQLQDVQVHSHESQECDGDDGKMRIVEDCPLQSEESCSYSESVTTLVWKYEPNDDVLMYTDVNSGLFECKGCAEIFTEKDNLRRHRLTCSGVRRHECNECGKTFSTQGSLRRHVLIHADVRPHKCDECGKMFSQKGNLEQHRLIHSGLKPYQCNECDKKFTHKQSLMVHVVIHSGLRPYKCEECGKTFVRKSGLRKHSVVHLGVKPHECEVCSRPFATKKTLKVHMQTHSNIKPHECEDCGKRFTQKYTLNKHRLMHSGDKPHECEVCKKTFAVMGNLKKHMVIHSNVRPHVCKECGRGFTQKSSLKTHMMMHSNIRPYVCEVCGKGFILKYRHMKLH